MPHVGPWCWLAVVARFLALSSPVPLDAFALSPLWRPSFSTSSLCLTLGCVRSTESVEAIRKNCRPLSSAGTSAGICPHTHFSSSHCGQTALVSGSGSAGPCAPTSVPSQIFRDTSSAIIPNPSVSSNFSSNWPCLPLVLHFLLPRYSKTP